MQQSPPTDLPVERLDLFLEKLKMTKRMADEESLMVSQAMTRDRSSKLRDLLTCLLFGQIGDLLRRHLPFKERCQYQSARDVEDIRQHVSERDVRILKHLLNPVAFPGVLAD